jgi:hypothetical protein
MRAFPGLTLGRRPIRARILTLYRVEPRALEARLPARLRPRLVGGSALAVACYTRLGSTRFFRGRSEGSHHLSYRFAAEREERDGWRAATWIARRETSSWLEARCGSKLLRGEYGRAAFRIKEEAFAVELEVEDERGEEFYLRAEASGVARHSLFAGPQALEEFLGAESSIEPYDVFAPEADELDLAGHFAPEPLAVFEARSDFLEDPAKLPPGAVELDSAWRLVSRRLAVAPEHAAARFRPILESGQSSPAMPTM